MAKRLVKLEKVSPRLLKSLPHPSKGDALDGVRFSPDGQRVVAGSYPGGVIRVWDVGTAKPLATIESGQGYRSGGEYFWLTPDWKTVFVTEDKRKSENVEKKGKTTIRFECSGAVRAWDLETGKLRDLYTHTPPRGISSMTLSPDGKSFLTHEELSGDEDDKRSAASLWDVTSKKARPLPSDRDRYGQFAPDSKSFTFTVEDTDGYTTSIGLIDASSLKAKVTITIQDKWTWAGVRAFSPDGSLMAGTYQVFAQKNDLETSRVYLKLWETATGKEVASLPADRKTYGLVFSKDGKTLAAVTSRAAEAKLFLFDVAARKLKQAIVIGEMLTMREPVFSPDSRWLAVITQSIPNRRGDRELTPEEIPQARIHLVDLATVSVRENLISPRGYAASLCFNPDGRLLASGGDGEVLLWDVADLTKEK